jgi:Leucine-rich repeat (LRR) protein
MGHEFKCPSCAVTLRTPAPIPPGKQVRCPRCNTTYIQPAAKPPARAAAPRPKPPAVVEEAALVAKPEEAQEPRQPRRPSLLGRLPRKVRKIVVQGMLLMVLGGLLLYGLLVAATFPAFDRALNKATELAQRQASPTSLAGVDPRGDTGAQKGDRPERKPPLPVGPDNTPRPPAEPEPTGPWKPSAAEKAAAQAVAKLGVGVHEQNDGWRLDLEAAKDLDAVVKLLPRLSRVAAVEVADKAADTHMAAFLHLKGLRRLRVRFNKKLTHAAFEQLGEASDLTVLDLWLVEKVTAATAAPVAGLKRLEELTFSHLPLGNKATPPLAQLRHLQKLVLTGCGLTEGALEPLEGLSALRELHLSYNEKLPGQELRHLAPLTRLTTLEVRATRVGDKDLSHLSGLTSLTILDLEETATSDEGLAHLAGLKQLGYLGLNGTRVKGPGLRHLAGMKELCALSLWDLPDFTGEGLQHPSGAARLEGLDLSSAGVTDAGLAQIKQLRQLTRLKLAAYGHPELNWEFFQDPHPERLSDKGLEHVGTMTNLKELSVSGSGITDAGLAYLDRLEKLEDLGLGFLPNVKGPGLEHLKGLTGLKRLNLKWTGVGDASMKYVKELTQIEEIILPRRLTDAGLEPLKGLKRLKSIRAYGLVSDRAVADLKKAFPAAVVEHVDNRYELKAEDEGPSPKQLAAEKALGKLDVETSYDADKGWTVDLSSAKDLDAALKLLPRLERIASLQAGEKMTDAQLAVVAAIAGLEGLSLQDNEQITDAGVAHLRRAVRLKQLDLASLENVTNRGLAHLAGLKDLQQLHLSEMELKDEGTKPLAALKQLRTLHLDGCALTDAGLARLSELKELRELSLRGNADVSSSLEHLAGLSHLETLDLGQTGVADAGLPHLAGMTSLVRLSLSGCRVSDAGLTHLARMTRLASLDLVQTEVKGPGLRHLAGMKELASLGLTNKDFTGEGLQHLTGCMKLTVLDLRQTGITDAGLAQIKRLEQMRTLGLPNYGLGGSDPFWEALHPERLSDKGMAHVGEMTDLEELSFSGGGICDKGLAALAGLKKLKSVGLGHWPNVKGPGLEHLKGLSELEELNLAETGVSDEGMKHVKVLAQIKTLTLPKKATDAALGTVKEMKNLEQVTVYPGVSEKAVADLKKALPKVEVDHQKEE